MQTINQPTTNAVTERQLNKLTDMMISRLGSKYRFRWMLGISFQVPVYYQDGYAKHALDVNGPEDRQNKPMEILQEGQDQQEDFVPTPPVVSDTTAGHFNHLVPTSLDVKPGIWIPRRGYHWQPVMHEVLWGRWVMAVRAPVMSREAWFHMYGVDLPYPEDGYWRPVMVPDNELSYCALQPGAQPNEANTERFIQAMQRDRGTPFSLAQSKEMEKRRAAASFEHARETALDKISPYTAFGGTYVTVPGLPAKPVKPIPTARHRKTAAGVGSMATPAGSAILDSLTTKEK